MLFTKQNRLVCLSLICIFLVTFNNSNASLLGKIKNTASSAASSVSNAASSVVSTANNAANTAASSASNAASSVASSASNTASSVASSASNTASNIASSASNVGSITVNTVSNTASQVANVASNVAETVVDAAGGKWECLNGNKVLDNQYVKKFLSVVPDEIVDIKSAGKFCTSLDVTGGELNFKFDADVSFLGSEYALNTSFGIGKDDGFSLSYLSLIKG